MTQEQKERMIEMLLKSGKVQIDQLSVGDHNTLNHYSKEEQTQNREKKEMPVPDIIAMAVLRVQNLFWGNSSYAVLFCVFRDCYIFNDNRSQYERNMALLPYKEQPKYQCTTGVVSSTINDNKYMELHIDKWKSNNAPDRTIKLMEGFKAALEELSQER